MADMLNLTGYAQHQGVSKVTVHDWIKSGKLGPEGEAFQKRGRFYFIDPEKADALLALHTKPTNHRLSFDAPAGDTGSGAPLSGKSNDLTYREASAWKTRFEALLKKHEFEVTTGKYVLTEDVRVAAFTTARTIRDSLLNIPDRIAPILAAENDDARISQLLAQEINVVLDELVKCEAV